MKRCKYCKFGACWNEKMKKNHPNCFGHFRDAEDHKCKFFDPREFDENDNLVPEKQIEKIKKDLAKTESGMELAGYLHGIEAAALIWCKKNSPDDVYTRGCGQSGVSICGLAAYLDSVIEEN